MIATKKRFVGYFSFIHGRVSGMEKISRRIRQDKEGNYVVVDGCRIRLNDERLSGESISETYLILFMEEEEGKLWKAFSEETLKDAKTVYDTLKQNRSYKHLLLAKVIESQDNQEERREDSV